MELFWTYQDLHPGGRMCISLPQTTSPNGHLADLPRMCADGRLGNMLDVIKYSMKHIFQPSPGIRDRYLAYFSSKFSESSFICVPCKQDLRPATNHLLSVNMNEKNHGPTDAENDGKVPLPIVVVDDEEKVILRKIDLQLVPNSSPFLPRVELLI
jgi:hypothetical protein